MDIIERVRRANLLRDYTRRLMDLTSHEFHLEDNHRFRVAITQEFQSRVTRILDELLSAAEREK